MLVCRVLTSCVRLVGCGVLVMSGPLACGRVNLTCLVRSVRWWKLCSILMRLGLVFPGSPSLLLHSGLLISGRWTRVTRMWTRRACLALRWYLMCARVWKCLCMWQRAAVACLFVLLLWIVRCRWLVGRCLTGVLTALLVMTALRMMVLHR